MTVLLRYMCIIVIRISLAADDSAVCELQENKRKRIAIADKNFITGY